MSERFKFTEEEQEKIARSQAVGNLTESSFAAPAGSPRPITVTQQELQEISAALSRHGEANLAAKIVGWLHEANS